MAEMKTFIHSKFGKIRACYFRERPWFLAPDITRVLGYDNVKEAIEKHVEERDKYFITYEPIILTCKDDRRLKETAFINELGLYCLACQSKLPEAMDIYHWIRDKVFPILRRDATVWRFE